MKSRPAYIHHIATTVPETAYTQNEIREIMLRHLEAKSKGARLLQRIYSHSGIEKRHSVIKDYRKGEGDGLFFDAKTKKFLSPSTKVRNDVYTREARKLFAEAARTVINGCSGIESRDITHVITVSCTGFFAPGPDYYIVKDLQLSAATHRFHIGFMGCFGAFPALKMADAFCASDPNAVVLVVCLELCTLHLEPSEEIDDIIATSVFADGAAAALVCSRLPDPSSSSLQIDFFSSTVADDSENDMAWTIGDHGFDMVLSTYVPRILEANVHSIVGTLLKETQLTMESINQWAIHPGGRAILDKVEQALELNVHALDASRHVLSEFGNMSSATILFVLEELLQSGKTDAGDTMYAMAFGPGLTVESALLTAV